ncbi:MAG: cupin domain-containing protein [Clostridiales bacterium]|nr:cupin domain-containing protein [Clostridiales bacterium]
MAKKQGDKMLIVDTNKPEGIWTGGENNRFLATFITPILYEYVEGLSVGMVIVPPETDSGLHEHKKAQEIWYVIEGKGEIQIGDEIKEIEPGSLVYSPPETKHRLINHSPDKSLKALLILCPDGDEKNILDKMNRTI